MSKPFALRSSSALKAQECFAVLRAAGGVVEEAEALAGRLSRGEEHGWIALGSERLAVRGLQLARQDLLSQGCAALAPCWWRLRGDARGVSIAHRTADASPAVPSSAVLPEVTRVHSRSVALTVACDKA